MAKRIKLKPIDPQLLDRLRRLPALDAPPEAVHRIDLPDGGPLAVLVLPRERLPFSRELACWVHLRTFQGMLVMLISTYELQAGPGGWAIPLACKPNNEFQAVQQVLGFDEGWENSFPAVMVLIWLTPAWRAALQCVLENGMLGVTVSGAETIFPMRLQSWQLEDLRVCLHERE